MTKSTTQGDGINITIKDIAYYLPEAVLTNEMLRTENPTWDIDRIRERTGVEKRHIAGVDETALDLAFRAAKQLLTRHDKLRERVDGLIFCTQSPDHIMPPNACILHKRLKLSEKTFAFDINLACSGYIYGLALAQGLIRSNMASNVLFVTADTYSKYISKQDRAARVLFGDGAAVSWIASSPGRSRILDTLCATCGEEYEKFIIPAGGCRTPRSPATSLPRIEESGNIRTEENIRMDGLGILAFVKAKVPDQVRSILDRNKLRPEDIRLYIFHQASSIALETLGQELGLAKDKIFRNLKDVGNTVSASIPIALKDAQVKGLVKSGDKVLLCGFGVGLSWGSSILEL